VTSGPVDRYEAAHHQLEESPNAPALPVSDCPRHRPRASAAGGASSTPATGRFRCAFQHYLPLVLRRSLCCVQRRLRPRIFRTIRRLSTSNYGKYRCTRREDHCTSVEVQRTRAGVQRTSAEERRTFARERRPSSRVRATRSGDRRTQAGVRRTPGGGRCSPVGVRRARDRQPDSADAVSRSIRSSAVLPTP
jgi:hypothetical protein